MAEVGQIALIEACEHRHPQKLQRRIGAALHRRAHQGAARVDRQEPDARGRHLRQGSLHRFADVVQLQIEKNLLAIRDQVAHERHSLGRVQLQTYFVEVDGAAEPRDESAGLLGVLEVERNNDRIAGHSSRMGFLPFSVTRPMRYAAGKARSNAAASDSDSEMSSPPEVCGSYKRSCNSDCPSTQADPNSRFFFRPPGTAPWRA